MNDDAFVFLNRDQRQHYVIDVDECVLICLKTLRKLFAEDVQGGVLSSF